MENTKKHVKHKNFKWAEKRRKRRKATRGEENQHQPPSSDMMNMCCRSIDVTANTCFSLCFHELRSRGNEE